MVIDDLKNDDIVKLKDSADYVVSIADKILSSRRSDVLSGLYSETKLNDEKRLSLEQPELYYSFRDLNVMIYIRFLKRSQSYTVSCENWQYKPQYEVNKSKVYRGLKSYGLKKSFGEIRDLYFQIVSFYLSDKLYEEIF